MMTATEFQIVPLSKLHESPLNPRRTFDPKKLEELAASIKAKGVMTPLLVRPNAKGFEIAAGHRRYRAAKAAGVESVPAVVREMTDAEFLELLVFENDEREDLHPLEEAQGYHLLMMEAGYDVARLAERRGCSAKYIYDRVKLLQLTKEVQKVFREGKITAGHAILLARLKPEDQRRAIALEDGDRYGRHKGGLWQHEHLLWDPDEKDAEDSLKAVTVRELEAWIDEHVRFDASATDLPDLFPDTAAVVAKAQEQEEKIVPITHEHYIQSEAREGRTLGPRSWTRADGRQKSKPCEHAVTGVIVIGPGRGEAYKVCVDKDKCAVHWGAETRQNANVRKSRVARTSDHQDRWKRDAEKRKAEQVAADAERARWKKALPNILEAVAAAVRKAPAKASGLLASLVIDQCRYRPGYGESKIDLDGYVKRGTTAEDLVRYAAFLVLVDEAVGYDGPKAFPKRAKAFGLDVGKIVDQAAPKAKAETPTTKPAKKVQTR